MALHPTSDLLRKTLEAMPEFGGRFTDLKLVNYNPITGIKRGCFSLVFRANDKPTGKSVALKFYDPALPLDIYRRTAFRREFEIIRLLVGAPRCLQLVQKLSVFELPVQAISGGPIPIPCEYFAVEWLDEEVDDYFLSRSGATPVEKLQLFREILLSIQALHNRSVFHRDIKADNLRSRSVGDGAVVVAIDLGTAARYESSAMVATYGAPVGASGYAGPEAICGLAGNRKLAPYTDIYAAGCLLFELFNPDYYFVAVENANPMYVHRIAALTTMLTGSNVEQVQIDEWNAALARAGRGFTTPPVDGNGTDVPAGVAAVLNDLLRALTSFDYRNRPLNGDWAIKRVNSAIKTLENEALAKRQAERRQVKKQRRLEKIAKQAKKLDDYLAKPRALKC